LAGLHVQPALHAQPLDGGGKRFIEDRVVRGVGHLVREFVKHQPRQFALRVADEGAQQRIAAGPVHPAQRGISRHAIDAGFKPLALELLRLGPGFGFAEVTPVADAAGHRKTPGFERERELGRGHHVPDHGAAVQIGVALVARVVGQLEIVHGKAANALGQGQAGFKWCRGLRVAQPVLHRAGRIEQGQMAVDRLPVVAQVSATGQAGRCHAGGQYASESCECHGQTSFSSRLHFDQAVVKHRPAAQVGQVLAGELVHIGAAKPQLAPPNSHAVHHAGPRAR
jgi:hypothetical protein